MINKLNIKLSLLFLSVSSALCCFAKEPINLDVVKTQLVQYHDTGQYEKEIDQIVKEAKRYLIMRLTQQNFTKKPAIVLDIDETALTNYQYFKQVDFGFKNETFFKTVELNAKSPPIHSVLTLYHLAKKHHVAVFFISARDGTRKDATIKNLVNAGYTQFDGLYLKEGKYQAVSRVQFKSGVRKQLSERGYDIIVNLGDQASDLKGGYADKAFKLPDPFYYLP